MGESRVQIIQNSGDRDRFYRKILNDLEAFERMLSAGLIEKRDDRIGVEQELCLVDLQAQPQMKATHILQDIADPHFTYELGLYNLEINVDPVLLAPDGFSQLENNLLNHLSIASRSAQSHDSHLFLTGILPTIQARHLHFEYMTPTDRYMAINNLLLEIRGSDFEIYLQGVDDFNVTLDSDLFEACNTSFQCHLQVNPDRFVAQHNWAQMISGPVLSCATNSPLLFGRELWSETRIALFKQSLDTRGSKDFTRISVPRVHFGGDWIYQSPAEIWQNGVTRFPLLIQSDYREDSLALLDQGEIPPLKALQLHNGTTYNWNRLCYGMQKGIAHTRIECRYLPAGPTVIDQMANFAFWVGLMKGQPSHLDHFWNYVDFRTAKDNFIRAARTGIHSVFNWFGEFMSAPKLICDILIPMAKRGLQEAGLNDESIEKYLAIIEVRARSGQTGSEWLIRNSRILRKKYKPALFNEILVKESIRYQQLNIPIHEWENLKDLDKYASDITHVEHLMNTEIKAVRNDVTVRVAKKIMGWQNIHHLPVENRKKEIIGLLSWTDIITCAENTQVDSVMMSPPFSINLNSSLNDARELLQRYEIEALCVMEEDRLAGIITSTDLIDR